MDDLQYTVILNYLGGIELWSFKPCYKWMTFNTLLNTLSENKFGLVCFKPCYKWMTFNTDQQFHIYQAFFYFCFKPCYKWMTFNTNEQVAELRDKWEVLNLVING